MGAANRRAVRGALLTLLVALQPLATFAQLSKPVATDANVDTSSKFLQREATKDMTIGTGVHEEPDEVLEDVCPQNIALKWHAEASSAVYATPLITDLFSDGRKDVVVPSFLHNLEVFEGRDGAKMPDFEAFHSSNAHTSPLLYDIDLDGVPDILLATYDGNILFFKDTGEEAAQRLTVPRLRVRQDWHKGLNPDHVDHSHPDVGAGTFPAPPVPPQQQGGTAQQRRRHLLQSAPDMQQQAQQQAQQQQQPQQPQQPQQQAQQQAQPQPQQQTQPQQQAQGQAQQAQQGQAPPQQQAQDQAQQGQAQQQAQGQAQQQAQGQAQQQGQQAQQQAQGQAQQAQQAQHAQQQGAEAEAVLSEEAADSFKEFFGEDDDEVLIEDGTGGAAFRDVDDSTGGQQREGQEGQEGEEEDIQEEQGAVGGGGAAAGQRRRHWRHIPMGHRGKQERPHGWEGGDPEGVHDYDLDYQLAREHEGMWEDEWFEGGSHHAAPEEKEQEQYKSPYMYVDAHILATPAIADIDGDGAEELVVPVSYFFDLQYYDNEEHRLELGLYAELGLYVASGIVVFDLHRKTIKWSQHLDLSTDFTQFKAYAYSAPTLADLDQDGKMEVIMGTSMGFLYVLDCYGGTRKGFPLQMGDIQAQVAVADIDNDGRLELVAGDARGNLAAFTADGKEVWETHLESQIHQNAVFGDVDGDGQLEAVVATFSGEVHVLRAATGQPMEPFPFRVFDKVLGAPLLTKLDDPKTAGLQIVVTAFDGFLYVIDSTGCADSLDLGESSYAQVLADDLDGNGRLDLLVATTNGNLYAIATAAKYHPLKTWTQQTMGGGSFTARWGWEGVYVTTESRKPRDVRGLQLPLRFKVVDERPAVRGAEARHLSKEDEAAYGGKEADELEDGGGGGGGKGSGGKRRAAPAGRGPYKVSIQLTGVGQKEMNAGEHPVIGMADVINGTGAYTMEIPCPRSRSTATIRVEMRDETRLLFVDEFSLSFHIHFYRLLKWLIAGPFIAAGVALLAFRQDVDALPA
ncbi:hypothetical protein ABPG75_011577 [Micractinium tetrahymenae]